MPRSYDIVTFDCYGTLIDWEQGIREAFAEQAARDGVSIDGDRVIEAYAAVEPAAQRPYQRYRDVLAATAIETARSLGWRLDPQRAGFLADSLPRWKPFADTNRGLEALRNAGVSLGILSNIDDDLLAATRRHFAVEFDLIVTAEEVRSYKPAHAHFTTARERIGDQRWLHAAQSNFHDIVPANALGIPTAWVNRKRAAPLDGGTPAIEVHDLEELARRVDASSMRE